MRLIAVCPLACESACAVELAALGCSGIEEKLGYCLLESDDPWFLLRYAQTVSHVLLDAGSSDPLELSEEAETYLRDAASFRVSALTGSRSQERELGAVLFERFSVRVDLSDPAVEIGIVYDRVGIVLSGFDYSIREYKVYQTPRSLNPCVAASILYGLGISFKKSLCDPLCHDGVIPIEFALAAHGISPRAFQDRTLASRFASRFDDPKTARKAYDPTILSLEQNANYLRRAEHNARLAGVASDIEFSRYDLEWLDMRIGESSIESCVLELPHKAAHTSDASYAKILEDVRFAADHMLDRGPLVVITNDPLVSFDGFVLDRRMVVPRGQLALYALVFRRA